MIYLYMFDHIYIYSTFDSIQIYLIVYKVKCAIA